MNYKAIFRKLIPMRWQRTSKNEPLSIVLLLRKPHLFNAQELRLAAQRAWLTSFAGGEGSMHCVAQSGEVTLLKAGPHVLNFLKIAALSPILFFGRTPVSATVQTCCSRLSRCLILVNWGNFASVRIVSNDFATWFSLSLARSPIACPLVTCFVESDTCCADMPVVSKTKIKRILSWFLMTWDEI